MSEDSLPGQSYSSIPARIAFCGFELLEQYWTDTKDVIPPTPLPKTSSFVELNTSFM